MTEQLKHISGKLKKELDKNRYQHTMGVMYTASCLAMRYACDMQKAMLAGLLHDCAKCISGKKQLELCKKNHIEIRKVEEENPYLLHAKLGAFLAEKKYQVTDRETLHAIAVHTTGEPEMNLLDKIIFVADYIEPNRDKAPNLERIRTIAFERIDQAVLEILHDTIHYLNQKRGSIDYKTHETYEYYKKTVESNA